MSSVFQNIKSVRKKNLNRKGLCPQSFRISRVQEFANWLCYYNNLDITPGFEALEKIRALYTDKGINIFQDAVSFPGVSLHYLLRGMIKRKAELYSPCK